MRLLLVAATEQELTPLISAMKFCGEISPQLRWYQYGDREIEVLITGVGMVATATRVAGVLSKRNYSAVVNAGICGSFDRSIEVGAVVRVHSDSLPELGAEDDTRFISIYDMNLLSKDEFPFHNGWLNGSSDVMYGTLLQLKSVNGITVNKVHGNENTIAEVVSRLNPQVETMEGAAFLYACSVAGVSGVQIRAVSNYVEKRNRASWEIGKAITNLNAELLKYLDKR